LINAPKFFPVSSGEDFRDMLLAVAESPPGAPKPTKLEQFAASHPNMPRALATVQTPDSFADEEYYGVNAFFLVNDKGERRAVRYIMAPEKLVHLEVEEAAKKAPRAFSDPMASENVSRSLFYRIFFTRTGVHFA
jgi:catalase